MTSLFFTGSSKLTIQYVIIWMMCIIISQYMYNVYNNSFVQVHQSQHCNPHRRPLVLAKAQVSAFKSVWNRTSYMWTYKYVPFIFFKNWRTLSLTFPGTPCLESVLGKKCEVQAVRQRARSPASHMCPRYQRRGFSRKSLSRKRLQKTLYYFFIKWTFSISGNPCQRSPNRW